MGTAAETNEVIDAMTRGTGLPGTWRPLRPLDLETWGRYLKLEGELPSDPISTRLLLRDFAGHRAELRRVDTVDADTVPRTCSEIPDLPILALLEHLDLLEDRTGRCAWATHGAGYAMASVAVAMPPGTPHRLQRAKMVRLIRQGLVGGCPCGCRGDYVITDAGAALVTPEASAAIATTADAEVARAEAEADRPIAWPPSWAAATLLPS